MNGQNIKYIKLVDALKKDPDNEKKTLYDNDPDIVMMRTRDKKILFRSLTILLLICTIVLLTYVINRYVALYNGDNENID